MLQARHSVALKWRLLFAVGAALLALILALNAYDKAQQLNTRRSLTLFPQARQIQPFQLGTKTPIFSESELKNHWTLLFFGFTHCSDVCPTTLAILNTVYQNLHTRSPQLQVVFVSIDPAHDREVQVNTYLQTFNSAFLGLSGTEAQLQKIKKQFAIFSEANNASGTTLINHTSSVLLINPKGEWVGLFPYGLSAALLQAELEKFIHPLS